MTGSFCSDPHKKVLTSSHLINILITMKHTSFCIMTFVQLSQKTLVSALTWLVMMMMMTASWDVVLCSLIEADMFQRCTLPPTTCNDGGSTLVYFHRTTRHYFPGSRHLHTCVSENLPTTCVSYASVSAVACVIPVPATPSRLWLITEKNTHKCQ